MSRKRKLWLQVSFVLFVMLLTAATNSITSGQIKENMLFLPVVSRARTPYWIESLKASGTVRDLARYQDNYLISGRSAESAFDFWIARLQSDGQVSWHRELSSGTIAALQPTVTDTVSLVGSTFAYGAGDRDFLVMQMDGDGTILWQKTVGGGEYDAARALARSSTGGFLVAGETYSFQDGSFDSDLWLVKFTDAGAISWQKTYGDDSTAEAGYSVLNTSDGGYLIAGSKSVDGWLVKIDAAGNIAWEKSVSDGGPSSTSSLVAAQQTADGGYIVAGQLKDINFWTVIILRLDANGNLENSTFFGYPAEFFDLRATPDGNYMAVGRAAGQIWLVKLDTSGQPLWQQAYGGSEENANALVVAPDGKITVAGSSCTYQIGGECAAWVLHLDSSGVVPNCSLLSTPGVSEVSKSLTVQESDVSVAETTAVAAESGLTIQSSPLTETILCPDSARAACLEKE